MIQIIPAIDIIDGRCVRLTKGDYDSKTVYDQSPVDMVKRYADHGLDRIHVVDLDGAKASAPKNLRLLEKMAIVDGVAIEWGGGIKSDIALRDVFNAGATYAVAGSIAVTDNEAFCRWLQTYGGDRMVLGADVRGRSVAINGWLDDTDATIDSLVAHFLPYGLNQMIVTDISKDGTFAGPAYDLYAELIEKYPAVQLCASGGIATIDDIARLDSMGAPCVVVGKAIYENRITLNQITDYLNI